MEPFDGDQSVGRARSPTDAWSAPCPMIDVETGTCSFDESAGLVAKLSRSPGPGPSGRCLVEELPDMRCPDPDRTWARLDDVSPDGSVDRLAAFLFRLVARQEVWRYQRQQRRQAMREWVAGARDQEGTPTLPPPLV